jgi:hypothetical protein
VAANNARYPKRISGILVYFGKTVHATERPDNAATVVVMM